MAIVRLLLFLVPCSSLVPPAPPPLYPRLFNPSDSGGTPQGTRTDPHQGAGHADRVTGQGDHERYLNIPLCLQQLLYSSFNRVRKQSHNFDQTCTWCVYNYNYFDCIQVSL